MKSLHLLLCIAVAATFFACDRNTTYTETTEEPASCFNCHSDQDTELIAAHLQWEHSVHGSSLNTNRSYTPCNQCHTSEGFKEFQSTGTLPANVDNPTPIHCFTCHEPHTNGDFRLTVSSPQAIADGTTVDVGSSNLCVACHQARRNVNTYVGTGTVNITSIHWGPHYSVQGDMLYGSNGYEYSGFNYGQTNHVGATDDGCVDCHMKFTRNSTVGGHTWNMRWTDDEGEILNTAACSPCHGSMGDFDYNGIQTEITGLADSLRTLLVGNSLLDAGDHPTLGQRTPEQAGAIWNFLMIEDDRSWGVHNADYARDLLQSAIDYLNTPPPAPAGPLATQPVVSGGGSK